MIVSRDINPERDFYYLGAKVIEIISNTDDNIIDFFSVFEKLNATEKVSVNLFVFTLDWLFLVGAINKSEKEEISKCF